MMCPKCQRYNLDTNEECEYCGTLLPKKNIDNKYKSQIKDISQAPKVPKERSESRFGIGVFFCLFLGFLGLIIGLLLYPSLSIERSTFLDGWKKCFVTVIIISVIIGVIVGVRTACLLSQMRGYY